MQKSAIVEHALSNKDHTILFGETQVLPHLSSILFSCRVSQLKYISTTISTNKKDESLVLNKYWIPALKHGKIELTKKKTNVIGQVMTNQDQKI